MRIYLDTSVYGGYYDKGMEASNKLVEWLNINQKSTVYYSDIVREELRSAPKDVLRVFQRIKNKKYIKTRRASVELADLYIRMGVLPIKSAQDAQHIAVASVNKIDYILSWNMTHMVSREGLFSQANKILNLPQVKILTPLKFLKQHGT